MPYYMKAYPLRALRAYAGWKDPGTGSLDDDEIVFVRQDLVVTRNSVSAEGDVIFEDASDAWRDFCRDQLRFAVPDWTADA